MRQGLVLVGLLVALGCAESEQAPEPRLDLEAERQALLELDRSQAEAARTSEDPIDTVFSRFAEDVRVLAPGRPTLEGRDASRAMWDEMVALPGYSLEFHPQFAEVGRAADFGYTMGTYRMTLPNDDGALEQTDGKYVTIWRREPDGRWMAVADMFNSNGPPVPVESQ